MGSVKAAHHRGAHQVTARRHVAYYNANPNTRCLGHCTCHALTVGTCTCGKACGRTLAEHPPTAKQPAKWTAGHAYDGGPPIYRPEVFACGSSAGASMGNAKRVETQPLKWW